MSGLEDRSFLVTGAASGIGARLCERLAAAGGKVVGADVAAMTPETCAAAKAAGLVVPVSLDVRDPDRWRAVIAQASDQFGGIDVLFNVAGILAPGYVAELELSDVDRHFDVNTKGVIYGTRLAAEHMLERGGGHVVNIASLASLAPVPGLSLYSASKFAVRAFSLAADMELRPRGVAVTVVCPDAVATPMLDLQRDHEAAALTFSGPRALSVDEVCDALLGRVLTARPMELALPFGRATMARLAGLFPALGAKTEPILRRAGRKKQRH